MGKMTWTKSYCKIEEHKTSIRHNCAHFLSSCARSRDKTNRISQTLTWSIPVTVSSVWLALYSIRSECGEDAQCVWSITRVPCSRLRMSVSLANSCGATQTSTPCVLQARTLYSWVTLGVWRRETLIHRCLSSTLPHSPRTMIRVWLRGHSCICRPPQARSQKSPVIISIDQQRYYLSGMHAGVSDFKNDSGILK